MTSHPRVSYLPLTVIPTWGVWDLDPQWWTSQLEFRFLVMCARYSIVWWWCSNTVTKQARPPQFAILLQWSGRHALYFDGEMMTFFSVNKVWSWPRHSTSSAITFSNHAFLSNRIRPVEYEVTFKTLNLLNPEKVPVNWEESLIKGQLEWLQGH